VVADDPIVKHLTTCLSVARVVPLNFGRATLTRDPRQAQFGFKLLF
jgi:hypothetical protein